MDRLGPAGPTVSRFGAVPPPAPPPPPAQPPPALQELARNAPYACGGCGLCLLIVVVLLLFLWERGQVKDEPVKPPAQVTQPAADQPATPPRAAPPPQPPAPVARPGPGVAVDTALGGRPGWTGRVSSHSVDWTRVKVVSGPGDAMTTSSTLQWDGTTNSYVTESASSIVKPTVTQAAPQTHRESRSSHGGGSRRVNPAVPSHEPVTRGGGSGDPCGDHADGGVARPTPTGGGGITPVPTPGHGN